MAWERIISQFPGTILGYTSPAEKSRLHPPFFFPTILLCFVLGNPRCWQTGCPQHKIWVLRAFHHFYYLFFKKSCLQRLHDLTQQHLTSETALTLHRHCLCFSKLESKQMWGQGAAEIWWTRSLIVWASSTPTLTGAVRLPCCFTTPFQWGCSKINSLWQCVLQETNQSLHCTGNIPTNRAAPGSQGERGDPAL